MPHIADKGSESLRIPAYNFMFSLFLPPKIASAVQLYGDVTIFDASASFLSPAEAGQTTRTKFAKMIAVGVVYVSDKKTV